MPFPNKDSLRKDLDKVALAPKPSRARPRDHWLKQATQLATQYSQSATPMNPAAVRAAVKVEGAGKRLIEAPTRAR